MGPVPPPRAFRPLDSEGTWEKRLNERPLFVLKVSSCEPESGVWYVPLGISSRTHRWYY
jgi:hypothetical protein